MNCMRLLWEGYDHQRYPSLPKLIFLTLLFTASETDHAERGCVADFQHLRRNKFSDSRNPQHEARQPAYLHHKKFRVKGG